MALGIMVSGLFVLLATLTLLPSAARRPDGRDRPGRRHREGRPRDRQSHARGAGRKRPRVLHPAESECIGRWVISGHAEPVGNFDSPGSQSGGPCCGHSAWSTRSANWVYLEDGIKYHWDRRRSHPGHAQLPREQTGVACRLTQVGFWHIIGHPAQAAAANGAADK